jgi:hypothetical protein
VNAELEAEVADWTCGECRRIPTRPVSFAADVVFEALFRANRLRQRRGIVLFAGESVGPNLIEEGDRIVIDFAPQVAIDGSKYPIEIVVPTPPQVLR